MMAEQSARSRSTLVWVLQTQLQRQIRIKDQGCTKVSPLVSASELGSLDGWMDGICLRMVTGQGSAGGCNNSRQAKYNDGQTTWHGTAAALATSEICDHVHPQAWAGSARIFCQRRLYVISIQFLSWLTNCLFLSCRKSSQWQKSSLQSYG
jgi:hypothetical protein